MPTFHVIEVCMQFQTLGQRHRYPGAQFAARTEQAVIKFNIVGFHLVMARKLLRNGDTHIRLQHSAILERNTAAERGANLAQYRLGLIVLRFHAVVQAQLLPLNDNAGQLSEGLKEVIVRQLDVAAELYPAPYPVVGVVTLGLACIAHGNICLVAKAVEFEHPVNVVAVVRQPGGIGTFIVAVDFSRSTTAQIDTGRAVPSQHSQHQLAAADLDRRIGTQRQATLLLPVADTITGRGIKPVAIGTHPAARPAACANLAHARTQGRELTHPDGRCRAVKRKCALGRGAYDLVFTDDEPVIALLLQQIRIGAEVDTPAQQAELRVTTFGMHHLERCHVSRDNLHPRVAHPQPELPTGRAVDVYKISDTVVQIHAQAKRAAP
ncbi:hypothetical protein ALP47_05119 [Pseudomonas savastanoi]|nr:hypothetical protein ALP47_05119 [Pseudomonas savastanoi]